MTLKRLSDSQIDTLYLYLRASIDPKDILLQLLVETGCRVSESLSLGPHSLIGNTVEIEPLKRSKPRAVALSPNLVTKLKTLSHHSRWINSATETRVYESQRRSLCRHYQAHTARLWGKREKIHTLRHTCFARLYAETKDLLLVKDWAGHRSIQSTLVYLEDERQREATKAMAKILKSGTGPTEDSS